MKTMRVFVPRLCLESSDGGLLLGCTDRSQTFCCITGLVPPTIEAKQHFHSQQDQLPSRCIFGIIGVLETSHEDVEICHNRNGQCLLHIQNNEGKVAIRWHSKNDHPVTQNFVVITYDSIRFNQSVFTEFVVGDNPPVVAEMSNVDLIKHSFCFHRQCMRCDKEQTVVLKDFTELERSRVMVVTSSLYAVAFRLVSLLLTFSTSVFSLGLFHSPVVKTALSQPAMCNQMRQKYSIMSARLKSASVSRKSLLSFVSYLWVHSLDVAIGLGVMIWLLQGDTASSVADGLLSNAEAVATELEELLNWMMGVPAGLKLNQPLAQFLGKFFLYHIFLWKAYLKALEPFAATVLSCTCLTGFLGFTVQLAVIQDIISMMTLHIYCFYVYAARLYNLQVYALSSLWRLFRGKKWNVLRRRVDSAVYDIDQLFLGTLLFTILLFLLPTTALFYAVFALLRVVVLIGHGMLAKVISAVSSLPLYWLALRLLCPATVSGNVHVSIVQRTPLCLSLELRPVSVSELYRADISSTGSSGTLSTPDPDKDWKCLVGKLLRGQLIYPWIPSGNSC